MSVIVANKLQHRKLFTFYIDHHVEGSYISLEDDVPVEEDELPQGQTPIWIDVPRETSHLEILKEVEKLVSSLHHHEEDEEGKKG